MTTQEQNQPVKQAQPEKKSKISKIDFAKMLVVAIFFDATLALIQLIPVAGSVMSMVFGVIPLMIFFIWYRLLGISFSNPKKGISFFGASLIELIPIVNILPTWTLEVIWMYVLENKEALLNKVPGTSKIANGVTGKNLNIPGNNRVDSVKNSARVSPHKFREFKGEIKTKQGTPKSMDGMSRSTRNPKDSSEEQGRSIKTKNSEPEHNPNYIFGKSARPFNQDKL